MGGVRNNKTEQYVGNRFAALLPRVPAFNDSAYAVALHQPLHINSAAINEHNYNGRLRALRNRFYQIELFFEEKKKDIKRTLSIISLYHSIE